MRFTVVVAVIGKRLGVFRLKYTTAGLTENLSAAPRLA
jgi:hypothetical protein